MIPSVSPFPPVSRVSLGYPVWYSPIPQTPDLFISIVPQ
jgi:hypothetical protein